MAYTVFFRAAKEVVRADDFIRKQSVVRHQVLKTVADELAATGAITHPRAKKNSKGDWSVLLIDNGEAYSYTLFISTFERDEARPEVKSETPSKRGALVIIDPSGPRDTVGGYHPGYWLVPRYAEFLAENQRAVFMQTIYQFVQGVPSENYNVNDDGSVTITIASLTCRAKWVWD